MPNSGLPVSSSCLDHRHRIFAGRGRIAGAVGEEEAVGLVRHHLVEASRSPAPPSPARRPRRGCGRCCAWSRNRSRRHAGGVSSSALLAIALPSAQPPPAQRYIWRQRHLLGEVHALQPRPGRAPWPASASTSNLPSARCAITPLGAPSVRIRRVSARVSTPAGRSGRCAFIQSSKVLRRAEIARRGHVLAHDAARAHADCPPPDPRDWRRHCRYAGR